MATINHANTKEYRPIAMRCNKEQFDEIRPFLEDKCNIDMWLK